MMDALGVDVASLADSRYPANTRTTVRKDIALHNSGGNPDDDLDLDMMSVDILGLHTDVASPVFTPPCSCVMVDAVVVDATDEDSDSSDDEEDSDSD